MKTFMLFAMCVALSHTRPVPLSQRDTDRSGGDLPVNFTSREATLAGTFFIDLFLLRIYLLFLLFIPQFLGMSQIDTY